MGTTVIFRFFYLLSYCNEIGTQRSYKMKKGVSFVEIFHISSCFFYLQIKKKTHVFILFTKNITYGKGRLTHRDQWVRSSITKYIKVCKDVNDI